MAFGGFGGPTSDMMKTLKRNKSLVNKRNSLKENHDANKNYESTPIELKKKFTEQEVEKSKIKFQAQRKKEKTRNTIIILAVAIAFSIFGYYYLF